MPDYFPGYLPLSYAPGSRFPVSALGVVQMDHLALTVQRKWLTEPCGNFHLWNCTLFGIQSSQLWAFCARRRSLSSHCQLSTSLWASVGNKRGEKYVFGEYQSSRLLNCRKQLEPIRAWLSSLPLMSCTQMALWLGSLDDNFRNVRKGLSAYPMLWLDHTQSIFYLILNTEMRITFS